jgi:hypothetical protein
MSLFPDIGLAVKRVPAMNAAASGECYPAGVDSHGGCLRPAISAAVSGESDWDGSYPSHLGVLSVMNAALRGEC